MANPRRTALSVDATVDNQKQQSRNKEINPFSEDEKHGPNAHRRSPENAEEYRGNPSVQRRAPGVEDDNDNDNDNDNESRKSGGRPVSASNKSTFMIRRFSR